MASVKVAVRVRPFNQRELDMGAKAVIRMDGKKTRIVNLSKVGDNPSFKDFTFDHSYWSFDPSDSDFATQEQVFEELGTEVVASAFEGYNACLFAYGQTGSGKTFTMTGPPDSPGLIPRICEAMFGKMQDEQEDKNYRVDVSYLEIYNEKVRDLLSSTNPTGGLRVREHPRQGPYVSGLSHHLVTCYDHVAQLMERGNRARCTAATNMNDTSSRSHAIFTLTFRQAGIGAEGLPSETTSKVHLVDLAGSERADATGATGQRLKEGAHINKSLVTLGSVISALADKRLGSFVPYRDAVLTWLLKDSLGGNSKTIMVAAISPADCNYSETLSTLRYANRAKNIVNQPTVNEDPNVRLIRELRDEIYKLRGLLGEESQPKVLAELQQKEAKEKSLTAEWAEKWRETQAILREQQALGLRKAGRGVVLDSDRPHLVAIDQDDRLSTGVTLYHLNRNGDTVIGAADGVDIVLPGLESHHCIVTLKDGIAVLTPKNGFCSVDGLTIDMSTRLSQGSLIGLGRAHVLRYNDPAEAAQLRKEGRVMSRSSLFGGSTTELNLNVEERELEAERRRLTREFEERKRQLDEERRRLEERQKEAEEQLRIREEKLEEQRKRIESQKEEEQEKVVEEQHQLKLLQDETLRRQELLKDLDAQLNEEQSTETLEAIHQVIRLQREELQELEQRVAERLIALQERQNRVAELDSQLEAAREEVEMARQALKERTEAELQAMHKRRASLSLALNGRGRLGPPSDDSFHTATDQPQTLWLPDSALSDSGLGLASPGEALTRKVAAQKEKILAALEDENCDKEALNDHIAHLQELQREQIRLETKASRRENSGSPARQPLEAEVDEAPLPMRSITFRRHSAFELSSPNRMPLTPVMFSSVTSLDRVTPLGRSLVYCSPLLSPASCNLPFPDELDETELRVSVPSYLLRGAGSGTHYEYEVRVSVAGARWTLLRRYKRFRELHMDMKARYGVQIEALPFPPRKFFTKNSEAVAKQRRRQLEVYLQKLLAVCSQLPSCPLYPCRETPSRLALLEFSAFFRKGVFETGKAGTS
ncbi:kinesin-like protein Klp98A isoform X2 [Neocloeon triangulifer]|uniref:kinesin-like protein Klp98A isoform X2 n=1 Tax=Neocloeon triangulifer TaxID=2078957 RepID=UPI00286F4B6D|nr:kinesin-like protein Klp98A isoform X2 [Neocloeon triangulifer]